MLDLRAVPAARTAQSVGTLLRAVGESLNQRFSVCAVQGELSGFSRAASGHCYFTLKDAEGAPAALRCAMFRRAASLTNFAPADGQQVEVRGRLGVYEPRGELQFVVESMQRAGWEIASHGLKWIDYRDHAPEAERADIDAGRPSAARTPRARRRRTGPGRSPPPTGRLGTA